MDFYVNLNDVCSLFYKFSTANVNLRQNILHIGLLMSKE
jgi:hypothetical protein